MRGSWSRSGLIDVSILPLSRELTQDLVYNVAREGFEPSRPDCSLCSRLFQSEEMFYMRNQSISSSPRVYLLHHRAIFFKDLFSNSKKRFRIKKLNQIFYYLFYNINVRFSLVLLVKSSHCHSRHFCFVV